MDIIPQVKHCVLMKFDPNLDPVVKSDLFQQLQDLRKDALLGILEMVGGPFAPSVSGPSSLNRGYTDALVVTFTSLANRDKYAADTQHQLILQQIVKNLIGGNEGLLRFDFEVH